jgi:hypothetical protein
MYVFLLYRKEKTSSPCQLNSTQKHIFRLSVQAHINRSVVHLPGRADRRGSITGAAVLGGIVEKAR